MSTPSTDPLLALRRAITSNAKIHFTKGSETVSSLPQATHIVLSPGVTFPKDTITRMRKSGAVSTDPKANPEDFIQLQAVFLAWHLKDASGADYMRRNRDNGVPVGFVNIAERKNLVEWLEGKVNDLERIAPQEGTCS